MPNQLGDLISRGEGGYNSYNRGTADGHILPANQRLDFSLMSLDELQRRQSLPKSDTDRIFAVGKYQLIPRTLAKSIADLGIKGSERFTPELQEKIFAESLILAKRPQIADYIKGVPGASLYSAQKATCQEWASVDDPDTPGKPYKRYEQQGNHATTRASDVAIALDSMRDAYRANIAKGMPPNEAWRSVTGQVAIAGVREEEPHLISLKDGAPSAGKTPHTARHEPSIREGQANTQVRELQGTLRDFGYRDSKGHTLVVDGNFGSSTDHALKSFQRAHHLLVDGIVGNHTLAALEDAKHWPLLSEATHPQHRLYAQVAQGIRKLPHQASGSEREAQNSAVALTIAAHASGLQRVDHVVFGANGVNLFAVQGRLDDPAHRRVHVELAHAMAHPPGQRSVAQPAHSHAMAAQHQAVSQRGPVVMGP